MRAYVNLETFRDEDQYKPLDAASFEHELNSCEFDNVAKLGEGAEGQAVISTRLNDGKWMIVKNFHESADLQAQKKAL